MIINGEEIEFKERKSYQSEYITLDDIYKHYPYPCWDTNLLQRKIVPKPYISKEQIKCGEKYSLDFYTWKKICETLFKYMFELLMTGKEIKLPARLGYLQIRKCPRTKGTKVTADGHYFRETGKFKRFSGPTTRMPYRPLIKWDRSNKESYFRFAWYYKINFVRSVWAKWFNAYKKDSSILNKFRSV